MSRRQNIIIAVLVLCALAAGWWFYNNKSNNIAFKVINQNDFDRVNELVEIPLSQLGIDSKQQFILVDSTDHEIAYQLTDSCILFQVNIAADSHAIYKLKNGSPATPIYKVFARFVPERKDDFAWENDIAAYRMYGPALAPENPSNGVDLWLKKTEELIVDTFYYREHELGLPYHIDYGKGLDCYKVGHTVGCGGVALIYNDSLLVGNHYDRWEIIEEGPLRTIFVLTYDSVPVGDKVLKESIQITVSAGSVFNKAEVIYEGAEPLDIRLAAGIFLHGEDCDGAIETGMPSNQWIAYAENARSDAGLDVGRNYVGIYMPEADNMGVIDGTLFLSRQYETGTIRTYYFGGGWSQWHFANDNEWVAAVQHEIDIINHPMQIELLQ